MRPRPCPASPVALNGPGKIGQRCLPQILYYTRMEPAPSIRGGIGATCAWRNGAPSFDRLDNIEQRDAAGRQSQAKSTCRPPTGEHESFAGQLLKQFGEKVAWQAGFCSDLTHHEALPGFLLRQMQESADCVLG